MIRLNRYVRWPISATTKLSFPRQNLLSHDKTHFSTAKELGRDPSTIKMATANDDNVNEDGESEVQKKCSLHIIFIVGINTEIS